MDHAKLIDTQMTQTEKMLCGGQLNVEHQNERVMA